MVAIQGGEQAINAANEALHPVVAKERKMPLPSKPQVSVNNSTHYNHVLSEGGIYTRTC